MVEPEWFFDDELSRLRLKWAASMREFGAADRGRGQGLASDARPAPARRVGEGGRRAAWTSVRRDQPADQV
jgi:hypothetical protein